MEVLLHLECSSTSIRVQSSIGSAPVVIDCSAQRYAIIASGKFVAGVAGSRVLLYSIENLLLCLNATRRTG